MPSFPSTEHLNLTDLMGVSTRGFDTTSALVLTLCLLGSSPAFGQSGDGTPPPAQLPPLIAECESGAGYNACSVWIWQGSTYSAIWSNGAVGQLTVASGDAADLQLQRADKSGTLAGLTATYTGQWNGSAVNDGKMTANFKGTSKGGTWTGTPTVTPVLKNPTLDHNYLNGYTAQLTGYAIFNGSGLYSSSLATMINDYRLRGEVAMSPGTSRPFTLRPMMLPQDYVKGASYQNLAAIAAIYSDGTTFGDPHVLKAMIDARQWMIDALTGIAGTVCRMGEQQATINDIGAALDKQRAREDAQSGAEKDASRMAYEFVSKLLSGGNVRRLPANAAVKRVWAEVNQRRSELASDPVKDGSGRLAIPSVTPLQCDLR
jgi:hypothetical protein